jgi:CheY-like chemotaxis protein
MSLGKPILIHNDNTYLLKKFHDNSWLSEKFSPSEKLDIDVQLSGFIDSCVAKRNVSAIFIKITLSTNYLELVGLRMGIHIRLSRIYPDIQNLPIIFLGEEKFEEITRVYKYSEILCSSGVYLVSEGRKEINWFFDALERGTLKGCQSTESLVQSLKIEPPSNYETSHSVANEWALMRYASMFDFDGDDENYVSFQKKLGDLDYPKSLHYKVLELKANRQRFKNLKNTIKPEIKGISNKKIGIIDDEFDKGWSDYYNYVLKKNNAQPYYFSGFESEATKARLLDQIKQWVLANLQSSNPIDVFIIDLRLHDDDFIEADFENLSGIQIVKYLKTNNPGVQVIISTASNKVWNYQKCIKLGAKYFSVKESPDTFSSRVSTIESFRNFMSQLSQAVSNSFLAELFRVIEDIKNNNCFQKNSNEEIDDFVDQTFSKNGRLDQIFNLLALDSQNDAIVHQCLLIVFQILERYCQLPLVGDFGKDRSNLSSGYVWLKDNTKLQIFVTSKDIYSSRMELGYGRFNFQNLEARETIISFNLHDELVPKIASVAGLDSTFLVKMISVLSCRENLEKNDIERLIALRYYRSNAAAHSTGNVIANYRLTYEDINFCVQILKKIFQ